MESIDVFVQVTGVRDILVASATPDHSVGQMLTTLALPVANDEALLIFLEDSPGPLSSDTLIEELLPLSASDEPAAGPLRLHLTHSREVEVSVRYNAEQLRRAFSPGATVSRVHHWAARRGFHLSPRDAAEHVLQIQGTSQRPDREVHMGCLVSREACGVAFDLVPRKRVEG